MRTIGDVQRYLQRLIELGRAMILIVQSECADGARPSLSYVPSRRPRASTKRCWLGGGPGTHLRLLWQRRFKRSTKILLYQKMFSSREPAANPGLLFYLTLTNESHWLSQENITMAFLRDEPKCWFWQAFRGNGGRVGIPCRSHQCHANQFRPCFRTANGAATLAPADRLALGHLTFQL